MVLLVLRPVGSITAFQHHVTRSLRRFHVGSPGSSPCSMAMFHNHAPLDLSQRPAVQCSHSVLFASSFFDLFLRTAIQCSSCYPLRLWSSALILTPLLSLAKGVSTSPALRGANGTFVLDKRSFRQPGPTGYKWRFSSPCSINALLHHVTRSLRINNFCFEHCGYSLDLLQRPVLRTARLLRFITKWLDHCVSTPCDSITAAVPRWISRFFALLARSLRLNTMCFDH